MKRDIIDKDSPMDGLKERIERPARTRKSAVVEAPPHKRLDLTGIALIGLGSILFLTLLLGNGGLIGDALGTFFRTLFGIASWLVPFALIGGGTIILTGRSPQQVARVSWGGTLILMAILAAFAQTIQGDYFDPEAVSSSGGYLGAVLAWGLEKLLGAAKPIGIILLIVGGIIVAADQPMRDLASALIARLRGQKPARELHKEIKRTEAKPKRSLAVVEAEVEEEEETPKPLSRSTRRPLRIRETEDPEPQLDFNPPQTSARGYELPPLNLLEEPPPRPKRTAQETQRNIETLEGTLEQFNIDANVVEVAHGPTITRYEIQLGPGVRVSRIKALADNIAMSMAASDIRLEAPIPGKAAIGVEVPTAKRAVITLRELCESLEFHDQTSKLTLALGKDVSGVNKYTDLTRMPHLLIGGATNSGKSICLVGIIMSLILRMTPKDLRLVMIDPKRVELSLFEGLPHLMCPVVKDVKEAPGVLRAVWREMDRRYDQFSERGVRNIEGWNSKVSEEERLPFIVVIIDELADMMMQSAAEVESSICRLAQLARATGIHLIIATQRPSVDVITGTIKANIASRIAFSVSSQIDSRTILDQAGADKLIGRGDMLFLPIDASKAVRIQGAYVGEDEIEKVCDFWRAQEKPHYVLNPVQIAIEEREAERKQKEDDLDPLWEEAVRFVVERQQASTSMLQRKFSIGFQRASRILDEMEERNVVGPRDGPRPREVLVDPMQLETMFSSGDQYMNPMPDDAWIDDED